MEFKKSKIFFLEKMTFLDYFRKFSCHQNYDNNSIFCAISIFFSKLLHKISYLSKFGRLKYFFSKISNLTFFFVFCQKYSRPETKKCKNNLFSFTVGLNAQRGPWGFCSPLKFRADSIYDPRWNVNVRFVHQNCMFWMCG